jgi:hypothetical protein
MIPKLFAVLIIVIAVIVPCGMLYGRTVERAPLPPEYTLVQPGNQELITAGKLAAGPAGG